MTDEFHDSLTDEQRELLLDGLRYVRSSVLLELHEPSPDVDAQREATLQEIETLSRRISGAKAPRAAAGVG